MAIKVYEKENLKLLNGSEIILAPLKIKYIHEFMDVYNNIKNATNDDEAIEILVECVRICMKQFCPEISKDISLVEDAVDLQMIYKIIEIGANIKIGQAKTDEVPKDKSMEGGSWDDLDLLALESEVFTLGIWKNFDDLEESLCMPELTVLLEKKREIDYNDRKFAAALQGVDLDKESGADKGQKEWEDMKARVFSRGKATDSNDILALQGQNATKAGFGIGMGLEYEDMR